MSNPYALPDINGNCPHPDAILITNSLGPPDGQCYLSNQNLGENQPCNAPPLLSYETMRKDIPAGFRGGFCAPTCTKGSDCPTLLTDPITGKKLQGIPRCTADLPGTPTDFVGHCYIGQNFTFGGNYNNTYSECEKYTNPENKENCNYTAYLMHQVYDDLLHRSESDCRKEFAERSDPEVNEIVKSHPEGAKLYETWCDGEINPVYFAGAGTRDAVWDLFGIDRPVQKSGCGPRYGNVPSSCSKVNCTQVKNEKICRTDPDISKCCRWRMNPVDSFDPTHVFTLVNMALIHDNAGI